MGKIADAVRTRRLLRASLALLLVAGFGVVVVYVTRPVRPTRERFEGVKVGMTRAEVEKVVGCPPGDYADEGIYPNLEPPQYCEYAGWVANDATLAVRFDERGVADDVVIMGVLKYPRPRLSLLQRIRRWVESATQS